MDLDTRELAAFIGRLRLGVQDILARTHPERFEIGRGAPQPGQHPHVLRLTDPLDATSAALVAEELNKAFWFEGHHVHRATPCAGDGPQIVYLAWTGAPYPGTELPRRT
jgi:hypothetical protein